MSKKKMSWFKFYPSDWQGDLNLRSCSMAARGLWAEMVCIMHSSEPKGYLSMSGAKLTNAMLATLCGASESEVKKLIKELEGAAVFSRLNDGTIYSRRIVRNEERAEKNRRNGAKGGNPALGSDKPSGGQMDNPSDNPSDKAGVKPYILETRDYNLEVPFPTKGETGTEVVSYSRAGGKSC
ncbi:hypothetical protein [Roseibium sp. MMSF_3544]|uniref:hypothetical protein n=1 Tax=unclassified Roseibium TaxID=2629323 RepID=UPI00273D3687|nr:hypothetical protein [Roseibium sp. MMSF_3544]